MTDTQAAKIIDLLESINARLSGAPVDDENEVFTAREASEYLKIGYDKLLDSVEDIPHFMIGKKYYFRKTTLSTWMHNQELKSIQPEPGKVRRINP